MSHDSWRELVKVSIISCLLFIRHFICVLVKLQCSHICRPIAVSEAWIFYSNLWIYFIFCNAGIYVVEFMTYMNIFVRRFSYSRHFNPCRSMIGSSNTQTQHKLSYEDRCVQNIESV